jgi:hypothetical protein
VSWEITMALGAAGLLGLVLSLRGKPTGLRDATAHWKKVTRV